MNPWIYWLASQANGISKLQYKLQYKPYLQKQEGIGPEVDLYVHAMHMHTHTHSHTGTHWTQLRIFF